MLSSEKDIQKAIEQEIDVAKVLSSILIVTDGSKTIWINSYNNERIVDISGVFVSTVFHPVNVKNLAKIEALLDEIRVSITDKNSVLRGATLVDPTPLATRLWQTIWVATGKSPVKCLYNVVELFIFKFLSDLKILDEDTSFSKVFEKSKSDPESALDYYARNTRAKIYKLFPKSDFDGTTIINGTIFVTEKGEANLSQATLFAKSLMHLNKYGEEFGSLTKIDKQFKTKLYESFLKQEVEALGQYFTPRAVVQSVIRMAGMHEPSYQFSGKNICDPFCGVGGFPLELLNLNEAMRGKYSPDAKGKIAPGFLLRGFDKGFERDDERTIILAKANMLIYTAELLFKNPSCTNEFSRMFNETFRLFKDNLGTFGHIIKEEDDKFDVILSNPPYVTSGSSIIKQEIATTQRTVNAYPINALGLEGLSMEWIVNSLKNNGRAFIVIPDGILARVNGKKLRDFILNECYLDAIVALPPRTFFSNAELTYILAITKKTPDENDQLPIQDFPVFTYLVSNIGERLSSVKREEIEENDLPEMERLFKIFQASRSTTKGIVEGESKRCKIQPVDSFRTGVHWVIDRWWNKDELISLGIEKIVHPVTREDFDSKVSMFTEAVADFEATVTAIEDSSKFKSIRLGDTDLFELSIGNRVVKKDLVDGASVPVYSANVYKPFGYVQESNFADYSVPTILWGIDGNFNINLVSKDIPFATTDHCGALRIKKNNIDSEYFLYAMRKQSKIVSFDRSFRASLANIRTFLVPVPILESGDFDLVEQKRLAAQYRALDSKLAKLHVLKSELDDMFVGYTSALNYVN